MIKQCLRLLYIWRSYLCKAHDTVNVDRGFDIAVKAVSLQVVILVHIQTIAVVGHNLQQLFLNKPVKRKISLNMVNAPGM